MSNPLTRELDILERAALVVLALQVALFGQLVMATGVEGATNGYPSLVTMTCIFIAVQRRLADKPPNRAAARWILASRVVVLTMLTLATMTVGFHRLVSDSTPAPGFMPQVLFALPWIAIALKGAGIGKLKPGSAMGLRVAWTMQSRLAWDRGHRALGRMLFWGGLLGLATSLIVAPFLSLGLWAATVALAVTTALIESWRTWRLDCDQAGRQSA